MFIYYILFLCMIQFATAYYFVTWDELHRVTSVEEFHSQVDQIVREFACEDCREMLTAILTRKFTHNLIYLRMELFHRRHSV